MNNVPQNGGANLKTENNANVQISDDYRYESGQKNSKKQKNNGRGPVKNNGKFSAKNGQKNYRNTAKPAAKNSDKIVKIADKTAKPVKNYSKKGKKSKLKIIPLGGLEQIGMNITAFEYG